MNSEKMNYKEQWILLEKLKKTNNKDFFKYLDVIYSEILIDLSDIYSTPLINSAETFKLYYEKYQNLRKVINKK